MRVFFLIKSKDRGHWAEDTLEEFYSVMYSARHTLFTVMHGIQRSRIFTTWKIFRKNY